MNCFQRPAGRYSTRSQRRASSWRGVGPSSHYRAYDFIFRAIPSGDARICIRRRFIHWVDWRAPPSPNRSIAKKFIKKRHGTPHQRTSDGGSDRREAGRRERERNWDSKKKTPEKQTETKLSLLYRAPPLHSTHPSPACIYFWAASFSPEGDLSCPYASSLAGCSISARRVAGNNWQSGGVATSKTTSKTARGSGMAQLSGKGWFPQWLSECGFANDNPGERSWFLVYSIVSYV